MLTLCCLFPPPLPPFPPPLFLLIHLTSTSSTSSSLPPDNVCGDSWHLVGNSCLKLLTAKESYDNAKLSCRGHSGVLASLTSTKKVDFVLKELQTMAATVSEGRARP